LQGKEPKKGIDSLHCATYRSAPSHCTLGAEPVTARSRANSPSSPSLVTLAAEPFHPRRLKVYPRRAELGGSALSHGQLGPEQFWVGGLAQMGTAPSLMLYKHCKSWLGTGQIWSPHWAMIGSAPSQLGLGDLNPLAASEPMLAVRLKEGGSAPSQVGLPAEG